MPAGIYIAGLDNVEPISSYPPRDTAVWVDRSNFKVGQTSDLARREMQYRRVFNQHVRFFDIAVVHDRYGFEQAMIQLGGPLYGHRLLGPTRRLTEWMMPPITPIQARDIILERLRQHRHGQHALNVGSLGRLQRWWEDREP